MTVVSLVLEHVGVGKQKERDVAHPVVDRGRRSGDTARRRAAAGVHLLAEAEFEAQDVGRRLRPERIGSARASEAGHHEPVDLILLDPALVEQIFEHLAGQNPHVAVTLLHDLGFGVSHDGAVTQAHFASS